MTTFRERWGTGPPQPKTDQPGSDKPLQEHVDWYVQQGYRVASQTEYSAHLVKPKKFSLIWALVFGLGYIWYYRSKMDEAVYLTVGADGKVSVS